MEIVPISSAELPIVSALSRKIWPICYKDIISEEQIDYMLNKMYALEALQDNVQKGHRFALIHTGVEAMGFCSFEVHFPDPGISKLHKLYVLPNQHHQGMGSALLSYAVQEAKKNQCHTIFLQVNKKNPAVAFYQKNGFMIKEEAVFDIGQGFVMDDFIMHMSW